MDERMYEDVNHLVEEIKKELPNIILPSVDVVDDSSKIDINGKDYVKSEESKED